LAQAGAAKSLKSAELIGAAVRRSRPLSAEGLRERLFTMAFSNLVYAQIWEDPAVDLESLALPAKAASSPSRPAAATC
jgi:S-adenosylmethionine-diacylglycerol 3-amino-3-carboxypropyl transferase